MKKLDVGSQSVASSVKYDSLGPLVVNSDGVSASNDYLLNALCDFDSFSDALPYHQLAEHDSRRARTDVPCSCC